MNLRYLALITQTTALFFLSLLFIPYSNAVRPFITDDARVVGDKLAQIESWVRVDNLTLQHWVLPAYGPTDWLELSLGGFHGSVDSQYSLVFPLAQAKVLLRVAESNKPPGLAIAAGAIFNTGFGGFKLSEISPYSYVALTQNLLDERFLIHFNLGLVKTVDHFVTTWGLGSQIRLFGQFHNIAEVISGDPYAEKAKGGAAQIGFRQFVSNQVQFDGTYGVGIWGNPRLPSWFSLGIRWVF